MLDSENKWRLTGSRDFLSEGEMAVGVWGVIGIVLLHKGLLTKL